MKTTDIHWPTKHDVAVFLEFIELRTKIASFFPMMLGFFWTIYHYHELNLGNAILFFVAGTIFDMCVTAINNTMDYHKALDDTYRSDENVIGRENLNFKQMVKIVLGLFMTAFILSLILVWRTDLMLLVLGGIMYVIGISYTFGPFPISRTPFGEFFSSMTMGFGIFYTAVFVTRYPTLLSSQLSMERLVIQFDWLETLKLFIMALPEVILIANIMLANNTRDLDTDIKNERYTLVYYIGRSNALLMYQAFSILPWLFWIGFGITGILPRWSLVMLLAAIPHYFLVRRYTQYVGQKRAFPEATKAYTLFCSVYLLTLILAVIFR
ncbi:MAG: UbiA family prenyltransferase [Aerococcus sp.]|nr:UbiA family prenyltransferase [Aerococcus sp.]